MITRFFLVFFFVLFLFSCNQKSREVVEKKEKKVEVEVVEKENKFLYEINVDSFKVETNKIKWGQSFSNILLKKGVSNLSIHNASLKSKNVFNLKKIRKGKNYTLLIKKGNKAPEFFIYEPDVYSYIVYKLTDSIYVNKVNKEITYHEKNISGVINSSLYMSFEENNYPPILVNMMVDVFAWQIDFFKIMPKDSYNVLYTEEQIDGKVVGIKNIKAAKFFHDKLNYYAIAYDQGFGDDYFDENGNSLRKTFLRSPLKFYRISSKFRKKRYHPVLKRYRDHLGTDYSAPRGTPIMSVADGIIKEVRWGKNNGRFVKISHNNIYSTQYLHMLKFKKGIKKGKKVLQGEVIGYVGSTGLATGPHVCFRFWRNGNQVDPYKQKDLPEGEPISPKHLNSFLYVKDKYILSLSD